MANGAWGVKLEPGKPQRYQCIQLLTDVHMGLVTRELLRIPAGEVENTRGVLPLEGELKGAHPRAGSEAARRRPQQRRNGPERRHCGWVEKTKA